MTNSNDVDRHLPVGSAIAVGHPANGVRWFRTDIGWIDQRMTPVPFDVLFDTIGHGAYCVLTDGAP